MENKYLLNGWQTDWPREWMHECQQLLLNYPQDNKSKIMVLTCWKKTNCSYQKEGARKSVLCSKDVLYQATRISSLGKTTHIFQNLLYPSNFPSWDTEDRSVVLPPPCPQAHLVIKAFFEDGPTNKLNYFCYATTNGEKAQSSRWTII